MSLMSIKKKKNYLDEECVLSCPTRKLKSIEKFNIPIDLLTKLMI